LQRSLEVADTIHEEVRRNAKDVEIAYTADDIVRIHRAGKIAILLSLEGGQSFGTACRCFVILPARRALHDAHALPYE